MDQPSVIIGMPCYGKIEPETMFSLIALLLRAGPLVHDLDYRSFMYIDNARNSLVRKAIDVKAPRLFGPIGRKSTHLFLGDADMTWPSLVIPRLLDHKKPVVGGIYFRRQPPHNPIIANFCHPAVNRDNRIQIIMIQPPSGKRGLMQVDCVGTGCVLIELAILSKMRERYGDEKWFRSEETGEDLWFFHRLKEMGIPVYVDLDLECGHISRQIVGREHWEAAITGNHLIQSRSTNEKEQGFEYACNPYHATRGVSLPSGTCGEVPGR